MRTFLKEVSVGFRVHFRYEQAIFWEFALPILMMVLFTLVFGGGRGFQADVAVTTNGDGLASKAAAVLESMAVLSVSHLNETSVDAALHRFHAVVMLRGNERSLRITLLIPRRTDEPRREMIRAMVARIALEMNSGLMNLPVSVVERAVGPAVADVTYSQFLVPGILGLAALATGLYGVSSTYVIDRNGGRLKLLRLTPGTLAPYFGALAVRHYLVTLVQAGIIVGLAAWWLGIRVAGQPGHLLAYYTLGTFAFMVLGIAIGVLVPSVQGSRGLASAVYMLMLFLGNAVYSIPGGIDRLAGWLPLNIFLRGFRALFNEGASITDVLRPGLALLAWAVVGLLPVVAALARGIDER